MEQTITTEHDKKIFRGKLLRLIKFIVIIAVVLVLTLLSIFVPFQSLLPAYAIEKRGEGELRVHFLDVGEGDCSIVEFPDGALLVIDAGNGDFAETNRILRYIKGLSYTSLSYLVTHADVDHYGGMARLISCYGAEKVYLPVVESGSSSYQNFKRVAAKKAAELDTLTRYGVIENASGAYLACISPYSAEEDDENDSSAVLLLNYNGVRVLFGGDISATRERRLLRDYMLLEGIFDSGEHRVRLENINVLKVAHHGSAYSSCADWLSLLSPEVAVISCGRGNRYSHPAAETLRRLLPVGAQVFRTDEQGATVLSITEAGYTIKTK